MAQRKGNGLQIVGLKVVFVIEDVVVRRARRSKKSGMGLEIEVKFGRRCHLCGIELRCQSSTHIYIRDHVPVSTTSPAGQLPLRSPCPVGGKNRTESNANQSQPRRNKGMYLPWWRFPTITTVSFGIVGSFKSARAAVKMTIGL